MRRGKRSSPDFGLSFLDVMSCGFGATILLLLIVDHRIDRGADNAPRNSLQVVSTLEAIRAESQQVLEALRKALSTQQSQNDAEIEESKALDAEATELTTEIATTNDSISTIKGEIAKLKSQIAENARSAEDKDEPSRYITRKGRQSLSGLKLNGNRILILLDSSSSMLDETLVNVLRRRNMNTEQKRKSPKWQRSLLILDWIGSQLKRSQLFQIYTFNTTATPVMQGSEAGGWERYDNGHTYSQATKQAKTLVPDGGTNLYTAFQTMRRMSPKPNNVILITDSLPTQSVTQPTRGLVNGKERMAHFIKAFNVLPRNVPMNVILLPFEGDPDAAGAFWRLASKTKGAFIVPSTDWP